MICIKLLSFVFLLLEILTLSSDDEDKQEKKPDTESQCLVNGSASDLDTETRAIESAAMEEPDSIARKHSPGVEGNTDQLPINYCCCF